MRISVVTSLNSLALQAGIKAFNSIEIDVCYVILELLYIDGAGQFKGTIDRGGKLMAGG